MSLLLLGCNHAPIQPPASAHLQQSDAVKANGDPAIPQPVLNSSALPPPKPTPKVETYSVVVQNVSAQELLFALARDAKLNVDIHPGITGAVTLNAIDQTLQQLLTRISKQVDMRWELDGPNLIVMPDTPYLRTYRVDYVNMARDTSVSTSINSQVSSGTTSGSGSSGGGSSGGNNSTTKVDNTAKNHFWETLEKNLKDLLRETDKVLPEGSNETTVERLDAQGDAAPARPPQPGEANGRTAQSGTTLIHRTTFREAAAVIVSPETGVVTVRATSRQHEKIVEFLDTVMSSARRQVMIEATILQVDLNDDYRQGINWERFRASDGSRFGITQPQLSSSPSTITPFTLRLLDNSKPLNLNVTVELLRSYGTVKVLSSPKLSVLNNQTAVLRVVDNVVYFNVSSNVTSGNQGAAQKSFTTTAQTVSVGLVMSVTPQIGSDRSIILNVRPSISNIAGFKADPNPDLLDVENLVPEIQTREIESIMRLTDGEIAVLGGLMQEGGNYATGKIPGAGDIPFLGELFTKRDNNSTKSELVIFLRPVVVDNPSVVGDFRNLRNYLPAQDFNERPAHAEMLPSRKNATEASH